MYTTQLSIALTIFTFIKAGIIGDDEISSIAGESSKQTLEDAAGVELDAASSNKDALVGMAVSGCRGCWGRVSEWVS